MADYDLEATLTSGQAFRWQKIGEAWQGVVAGRWVELRAIPGGLEARLAGPVTDWSWLEHYLQTKVNLAEVLAAFPDDPPLREAVAACRGLRLLRQDPWECLASFILSSTKQIAQIQQMVGLLCRRFGQPVAAPDEASPAWAFPAAAALADQSESELRKCKLGFRAGYLREAARRVADGRLDLESLTGADETTARQTLMALPGVGPKIAHCVMLFALGFPRAFPVDVWIARALRRWYFPRRRPRWRELEHFAASHFGPQAGYAQQYLFHHARRLKRLDRCGRSA